MNSGSGTKCSHLEEGIDENYVSQNRTIDGVVYPTIREEIMTGFIDSKNYITNITLGFLEDFGFVVNYNSPHIKNDVELME